ncbi:MAG: DUF6518 family protein, partial [Actinomycetes bacterium]
MSSRLPWASLLNLSDISPQALSFASQLVSPWLVGAFLAAARSENFLRGLAASVAFILVGLAAFATFKWMSYGRNSIRPLYEDEALFWLVATPAAALVSACAARVLRCPRSWGRALGLAMPAAVVVAEGVSIILGRTPY